METNTSSIKKFRFIAMLCIIFNTYNATSQIRLIKVDPTTTTADEITIKNFGSSTVDISEYWLCARFTYGQLSTLTASASLNLAAGAEVVISGFNLNNTSSDVGLYLPIETTADFASENFMIDFMQYGGAGIGRESVANGAGIWTAGDFLTGTGPFSYNGNGSENGLTAWGTTLSINDELLNASLSIYPNPVKENLNIRELEQVNLKNASVYDISGRLVKLTDLNNNLMGKIIDLRNIQSGLYVLNLIDIQGRVLTKKFVKE